MDVQTSSFDNDADSTREQAAGDTSGQATDRTAEEAKHSFWNAKTYWTFFSASCVLSFFLILLSSRELHGAFSDSNLLEDSVKGFKCIFVYGFDGASCEHETGPEPTLAVINSRIHPLPNLLNGVLQIAGVVAISFLWFCTFILNAKKYTILSVVATAAYVLGMFNAYQPAVLVAALVAIFVAAEHYEKLDKQGRLLQRSQQFLEGTNEKLKVQTEALSQQTSQLTTQTKEITEQKVSTQTILEGIIQIANSTQLSLNKAGLKLFIQKVYGAYSRAETIYAVVRHHKIDEDWWKHAERDLAGVWGWYTSLRPTAEGGDSNLTLYFALTQMREQVELLSSEAHAAVCPLPTKGVSSAYFVSYMPLPGSPEWPSSAPTASAVRSEFFTSLLGLVWECLVLDEVSRELKNDSIRQWISSPLIWAHATDKEVWQVIKRNTFDNSNVLKTADLLKTVDNQMDADLSGKIIQSTQAEIRRYLQRGAPAEEYLCALLYYAAVETTHREKMWHEIEDAQLTACLKWIFMEDWLQAKKVGEERERAEAIAIAVFKKFIDMCWDKPYAGKDAERSNLTSSFFLAHELL